MSGFWFWVRKASKFRVSGLGFWVRKISKFRVSRLGFWVRKVSKFIRVSGLGFWVRKVSKFRVSGLGVLGLEPRAPNNRSSSKVGGLARIVKTLWRACLFCAV